MCLCVHLFFFSIIHSEVFSYIPLPPPHTPTCPYPGYIGAGHVSNKHMEYYILLFNLVVSQQCFDPLSIARPNVDHNCVLHKQHDITVTLNLPLRLSWENHILYANWMIL